MLRLPPMYRKRSARDGSGVQTACHQRCSGHRPSHYRADISHLLSAKRSRSCERKAALCRRWRAGSVEPHQPFPRAAAERPHSRWRPGVSRDDRTVARRAIGSSAKTGEACARSGLTHLCARAPGRNGRRSKRGSSSWSTVSWKGRRHGLRQDRRWARAWSPEQIARRLSVDFPNDMTMRISHEAIYQALFVQGRGALRREFAACLRTGRVLRVPRTAI
jgi:hypothetical protein